MAIALENLRCDWSDTVPPREPESDGRIPCLMAALVLMGKQLLPEGSPGLMGQTESLS